MNNIELKEILSAEIKQYKKFLTTGLLCDEKGLLITLKDNARAPFPTKDRNDSFTLGAYTESRLVGVISFNRYGEHREKLRHKGFISAMYVAKEFRGQGIAKLLLKEIIKRAKNISGMEQINLIVVSNNSRAKRLYKKFGFKKFGTEMNSEKWRGEYFSEDHMVLKLN